MWNDCLDMLKAILGVLDGAKYLWHGKEESPDSGNCWGCDNWKTSVISAHNTSIAEVSSSDNDYSEMEGLWKKQK